jgi:hypothetical protein
MTMIWNRAELSLESYVQVCLLTFHVYVLYKMCIAKVDPFSTWEYIQALKMSPFDVFLFSTHSRALLSPSLKNSCIRTKWNMKNLEYPFYSLFISKNNKKNWKDEMMARVMKFLCFHGKFSLYSSLFLQVDNDDFWNKNFEEIQYENLLWN